MAHEGDKIAFSKVAPSKSNLRLDYTLPERRLSVKLKERYSSTFW